MKKDRVLNAVENASSRVDAAIDRHAGEPRVQTAPDNSGAILRFFPYFVLVCIGLWIFVTIHNASYSVPKLVETLCLSFTFCFAIIGVPLALRLPKGVLSSWHLLAFAMVVTCILWILGSLYGNLYFSYAIGEILNAIGIELTGWTEIIVGFLGTLAVMLFTPIAVVSVISAYLCRYIPSVIHGMNRNAKEGRRGKAEKFFMVPDVLDVKEVVLDPEVTAHKFDLRGFLEIALYLFALGMLISSYLFVNPYFLEEMSWKTMLAIMMMLAMFTPALMLPWQIFRNIGAKVRTDAPRDYYLWKGAKNRLFTTFFALGAFMMMFILSLYLGTDVFRIIANYVSFLLPLAMTSVMYALVYTNNFTDHDRMSIIGKVR